MNVLVAYKKHNVIKKNKNKNQFVGYYVGLYPFWIHFGFYMNEFSSHKLNTKTLFAIINIKRLFFVVHFSNSQTLQFIILNFYFLYQK